MGTKHDCQLVRMNVYVGNENGMALLVINKRTCSRRTNFFKCQRAEKKNGHRVGLCVDGKCGCWVGQFVVAWQSVCLIFV